jgi:hypothetical protein
MRRRIGSEHKTGEKGSENTYKPLSSNGNVN